MFVKAIRYLLVACFCFFLNTPLFAEPIKTSILKTAEKVIVAPKKLIIVSAPGALQVIAQDPSGNLWQVSVNNFQEGKKYDAFVDPDGYKIYLGDAIPKGNQANYSAVGKKSVFGRHLLLTATSPNAQTTEATSSAPSSTVAPAPATTPNPTPAPEIAPSPAPSITPPTTTTPTPSVNSGGQPQ